MMKNFLLILATCLFALGAQSQEMKQDEHMKFKGIPMEGTVKSFVKKLEAKGYTYDGQGDNVTYLKGDFAGVNNCSIVIKRFCGRDQVSSVSVIFPVETTWKGITNMYYYLKTMLTKKYGSPQSTERFSDFDPEDNRFRFKKLLNNECDYTSEFNGVNGTIKLVMKKYDYTSAAVILTYLDVANKEEFLQNAMDDL
jgi:hypothetical protein